MTTTKQKSRRVIARTSFTEVRRSGVCLEKKGSKSETVTEFTRKRAMEKRPFNCVRVERVTEKAKAEAMEDNRGSAEVQNKVMWSTYTTRKVVAKFPWECLAREDACKNNQVTAPACSRWRKFGSDREMHFPLQRDREQKHS